MTAVHLTLILHLLLCAGFVALGFSIRQGLANLKRHGAGGADEDLDRARRIARGLLWRGLAMVGSSIIMVAMGWIWAPQWRDTLGGQIGLTIVWLAALALFFWIMACTLRQQWSAKGSTAGLFLGVAQGFATAPLVGVAMWWRFGLY